MTGYNATDGVRQKFTSKERDIETELDYFEARYYSSMQGRFTGVDPFNIALEVQEEAEHNTVSVLTQVGLDDGSRHKFE